MVEIFQFALIGLGAGALYGLLALGLVLVYRGSGVINFAHGAIGMVGTFAYYELYVVNHWPFAPAFVISLMFCGVIGIAIQMLVMKPLRRSSPVVRLLATLGVLSLLQGLVALHFTGEANYVPSSLPISTVKIAGATIGVDQIAIFGIAVILTAGLGVVYKRTKFGLATSAVAENPGAAAHLGYSANFIASANWAIGSMLAGVAGILLAPIIGLSVTGFTLLVIPALAAAVAGKMISFPVTLGAGLLMGIIQSELTRYVANPGWSSVVPFGVIIAVFMLRGSILPTRGEASWRLPSVGTGQVRLRVLIPVLTLSVLLVETLGLIWVSAIALTLMFAIVGLSVVVVTGYAGQLSLAQWALAGLGAWIAARLVSVEGFPFWVALLVGVVAMLPIGAVVGLPALRVRGVQLAILTLGIAVVISAMIFDAPGLTGSSAGLDVGFPTLFGLRVDDVNHPRSYTMVVLGFFVASALVVVNLRRGRAGRRVLALRSNERAAASLGISVAGVKLYAFSLGAMIASLGGILYAFQNPQVLFGFYQPTSSISIVEYTAIGGLGYAFGPVAGSQLQPGAFGTTIGNLFSVGIQQYLLPVGGLSLILVLIANQDGMVAGEIRRWSAVGTRLRRKFLAREPKSNKKAAIDIAPEGSDNTPKSPSRVTEKLLSIEGLTVRFGNNQVLTDVSLRAEPGKIVGLIGPNGAGKTTLLDATTGYVTPASGTFLLNGVKINRLTAHQRARAGIARSYQSLELFEDMSVRENLLVASEPCRWWNYVTDGIYPGRSIMTSALLQAIDLFGLSDVLDERPTSLPYSQRRLIAIARAVASEPSVLLLDEPASGLGENERDELRTLIRYLAEKRGIAVLLIEHDVDLVMSISDHIVVLNFGNVIAKGNRETLLADPRVITAYLGEAEDGDQSPSRTAPRNGFTIDNSSELQL